MPEQQTPYAAPKSSLDGELTPLEVVPVGRWIRFANYIIDYIMAMILIIPIFVGLAFVIGDPEQNTLEGVPDLLIGAIIFLLYYIPFEALTGRTIGKYITDTRVVNEQGFKPSFQQILGRSFARLIPFEQLSFFASEGRGWHDTMSKTYVVRCR